MRRRSPATRASAKARAESQRLNARPSGGGEIGPQQRDGSDHESLSLHHCDDALGYQLEEKRNADGKNPFDQQVERVVKGAGLREGVGEDHDEPDGQRRGPELETAERNQNVDRTGSEDHQRPSGVEICG